METDDLTFSSKHFWGSVLVSVEADDAGMEHHYWFHVTDNGRWVLSSEVVHTSDNERHYVDADKIKIPPVVDEWIANNYAGVETFDQTDL